jgi:hypothetical protein
MLSWNNRKFLLKNFCEDKNNKLEKKSSTNIESTETPKKTKPSFISKLSNFIPLKIYKKNNTYYISLNDIAHKYKVIGVLVNRKIREKNPKVWNNVVAAGAL